MARQEISNPFALLISEQRYSVGINKRLSRTDLQIGNAPGPLRLEMEDEAGIKFWQQIIGMTITWLEMETTREKVPRENIDEAPMAAAGIRLFVVDRRGNLNLRHSVILESNIGVVYLKRPPKPNSYLKSGLDFPNSFSSVSRNTKANSQDK